MFPFKHKHPTMVERMLISDVAEYLSYAPYLTAQSPDCQYQRTNYLAGKLAVLLDADLYIELGQAIANPSPACCPGTIMCKLRDRYGVGKLSPSVYITHAPGIGKPKEVTWTDAHS